MSERCPGVNNRAFWHSCYDVGGRRDFGGGKLAAMGLSSEVFGPASRSATPSSDRDLSCDPGTSFATALTGIGSQQTTAQRPDRSLRHVHALGPAVPLCQQQGTASSAAEHSPAVCIW
jgi:hypothetical protein